MYVVALLGAAACGWDDDPRTLASSYPRVGDVAPPAPGQAPTPSLWRVQRARTTVYLFGTMHALPVDEGWFNSTIQEAFDSSDELMLEALLTDGPDQVPRPPDDDIEAKLVSYPELRAFVQPQDRRISDLLPGHLLPRYRSMRQAYGLEEDIYDRVMPGVTNVDLLYAILDRGGLRGRDGAENVLWRKAIASGKQVGGLTPRHVHLGYLYAGSEADQLNLLVDTLQANPQDILRTARNGYHVFLRGVDNFLQSATASAEDIDRNTMWATWIQQRLERPGVVFVAVGYLHLVGEASVQKRLEKLGIDSALVRQGPKAR